jgi:hypothetical protein
MKVNITPQLAAAIISVMALAECAPTTPPETTSLEPGPLVTDFPGTTVNETAPAVIFNGKLRKRTNDCGDSTFVNQTSGGSPTVADCQTLANNIAGDGTWTTNPFAQRTLATYGTCAFGITNSGPWTIYVGNEDIRDLIRSSISQYNWFGLVGAKGDMPCQTDIFGTSWQVTWGIFHT